MGLTPFFDNRFFMKTTSFIPREAFRKNGPEKRAWLVLDASNQRVGRLATKIATILQGKHKPIYSPHVDTGDYVVVVNAKEVALSGNKWQDKMYYHHSGHHGGLKAINAKDKLEKDPRSLINSAVRGMMPKNNLSRQMLQKLKVYEGAEHPHEAQISKPLAV